LKPYYRQTNVFNLLKHSQELGLVSDLNNLTDRTNTELTDQLSPGDIGESGNTAEDATTGLNVEQNRITENMANAIAYNDIMTQIKSFGPEVEAYLITQPAFQDFENRYNSLKNQVVNMNTVSGMDPKAYNTRAFELARSSDFVKMKDNILSMARSIADKIKVRNQMQEQELKQSSNVKQYKIGQASFPVLDVGDLVHKFLTRLVTNNPTVYAQAVDEIITQVHGEIQEEEIKSILETLRDETDQSQGACILAKIYELLPGRLKSNSSHNTMLSAQVGEIKNKKGKIIMDRQKRVMGKKNPKGIIKFNLSNQVLNNKVEKIANSKDSDDMIKTAADQFGQQYLLYGPTEKRICPKLRGKGGGYPGTGDVVSEYICRHHCLDGIVIDDNKTICGEALWRANAMDKFSREYVDPDGNIQGGYLNKRFEINRNVPEENKMRLKPGETRKPRPTEIYGNYEARMQAMRKTKGKDRGYRPDTNTGDPFQWTTDIDQNNVEQSQSTRDNREKSMGHQMVQYSKKPPTENKPKLASIEKQSERWMQEAAEGIEEKGTKGDFTEYCGGNVTNECIERGLAEGGKRAQQANFARNARKAKKKKSFNLKHFKTAELPQPLPQDGVNMEKFLQDPKRREVKPLLGLPSKHEEPVIQQSRFIETPIGDQIDEFEQAKREKESLAGDIIQLNRAPNSAIQEVASKWSVGIDPGVESLKEAYKELSSSIDPDQVNISAMDQEKVKQVESMMEKIQSFIEPEKYLEHLGSRHFNLNQYKQAKKNGFTYKGEHFKYNPFAVCNSTTGGKNKVGKEKWERCIKNVKNQDRKKKSLQSKSKKKT